MVCLDSPALSLNLLFGTFRQTLEVCASSISVDSEIYACHFVVNRDAGRPMNSSKRHHSRRS
jgi:hypothetical protein